MSFRSDSLHDRLNEKQRDALMIAIVSAKEEDRFEVGLKLCQEWKVKASRTGVHDFFKRYYFMWRLDRAAWAADQTKNCSEFEKAKRKIIAQKLFAEVADADCSPKILIMIRSLELEQDKISQRAEMLEHNKEKFRESLRSKLEAGMQALFEQIKGNKKALEAFQAMKAEIAK